MSQKRPNVGDTVIIEGLVTQTEESACYIKTCKHSLYLYVGYDRIKTIISRTIPQVGDTVYYTDSDGYESSPKTLLYIQEDPNSPIARKWGVIAFKTDIPTVVPFKQLRLVP